MSDKTKDEQVEYSKETRPNVLIPALESTYDLRHDEFRYTLNGSLLNGAISLTPEFVKECDEITWSIIQLIRKFCKKEE